MRTEIWMRIRPMAAIMLKIQPYGIKLGYFKEIPMYILAGKEKLNQVRNNELLQLHATTVETAKEAERGIVDMETLKNTNESLISTSDEVMKIQTEGREKRRQAEVELQSMENQLKEKFLQISTGSVTV